MLAASDGANSAATGFPVATYTGLGHLATATLTQTAQYQTVFGYTGTFESSETTSYDGLGNILSATNGWGFSTAGRSAANTSSTTNTYTGQNRLSTRVVVTGGAPTRTTGYSYDGAGNTVFESTSDGSPNGTAEERAAFYGADERLVASDLRVSGRRVFEEYRYDPLGRRIWVSTSTSCAPLNAIECITSAVRRTVWEGDREAAEIQAPIDPTNSAVEELDIGFPVLPYNPAAGSYGDPNPFFWRVVYAPGLAIDQPIDRIFLGEPSRPRIIHPVPHVLQPGPILLVPEETPLPARPPHLPPVLVVGTVRKGPLEQHAPLGALAPHRRTARPPGRIGLRPGPVAEHPIARRPPIVPERHQREPGPGQRPRRQPRLVAVLVSRHTHGLAGGLNLYGFANGDPVNFSDPFGLFDVEYGDKETEALVAALRKRSKTFDEAVAKLENDHSVLVTVGRGSTIPCGGSGGCTVATGMNDKRQQGISVTWDAGGVISDHRLEAFLGGAADINTVLGHEIAGHALGGVSVVGGRASFRCDQTCAILAEQRIRREIGTPPRKSPY